MLINKLLLVIIEVKKEMEITTIEPIKEIISRKKYPQKQRDYNLRNRDIINQKRRERYKINREKEINYSKEYHKTHKEQVKERNRLRYLDKKSKQEKKEDVKPII